MPIGHHLGQGASKKRGQDPTTANLRDRALAFCGRQCGGIAAYIGPAQFWMFVMGLGEPIVFHLVDVTPCRCPRA